MLIFFTGSIGDTLIMLPFLKKFRSLFSDEKIRMLHDTTACGCRELLENSGYIDEFLPFQGGRGIAGKIRLVLGLRRMLRPLHEKRMIYLLRTQQEMNKRIRRDSMFFRMVGIKTLLGTHDCFEFPPAAVHPVPEVPHHLTLMARRLQADGIRLTPQELAEFDLNLQPEEMRNAAGWNTRMQKAAGGRRAIAVGIGGNKAICRWPLERYIEVLQNLVREMSVFPVFFGGPKDEPEIQTVLTAVGTGASAGAFGTLSLRETVGAMHQCAWYLGNDTGTLHMAVAAGLKCVAVYSAHNYRGLWYPFGEEHKVLRAQIGCECCYQKNCPHHCPHGDPAECLLRISVDDVLQKCREMNCMK